MEVYVSGIETTNPLMWPLVIPVIHKALVSGKHLSLVDVRFIERLNLADRRRPTHIRDDMFNPVSTAELRELRPASSCRIELCIPIRQDLFRFAVLGDGFFQKLDRMLRGWVVMSP